jgi:hypothetical protein
MLANCEFPIAISVIKMLVVQVPFPFGICWMRADARRKGFWLVIKGGFNGRSAPKGFRA